MKHRSLIIRCFILIALFISYFSSAAQNIEFKGKVISEDTAEPLIGASVLIKEKSIGTITDIDGVFSVSAEIGDELTVSYLGYSTKKVLINDIQYLTIELSEDSKLIDEIVVIGYGQSRKSDLTGSVSSIKSDELAKTTVTSLEQGLQGQVAGVNVTQGDAAPGAGISIQIRGTNSILGGNEPLYVIDGIPITNPAASREDLATSNGDAQIISNTNVLATLSPSDIESIEILKDASATAIYGSRGANGVVIITTKSGKEQRGKVSFNISTGFAEVANKIELLDAERFMEYQNTAYANAGITPESYLWAPDTLSNPTKPTISQILDRKADVEVDWQDEIFQRAPIQDYQLGFSGGGKMGSFSIMLNHLNQQGIIIGSQFMRNGLRTNSSLKVNDRITVNGNVAFSKATNNLVRTTTGTTQSAGGIIRSVLNYSPIRSVVVNDDGLLDVVGASEDDPRLEDPAVFQQFGANPLRYTDEVTESHNFSRVIGGINTQVDLGLGLALDIRLATNYVDRKNYTYYPRTTSEGFGLNGLAVVSNNEFSNYISENLLRYSKEFNRSRLNALAGFSYEVNRDSWINNEARDFPDDNLAYYALQNGLSHVPTRTNASTWKLASYLGRVNYTLDEKYLLTGTFRYDGSSKFATNNKWAPFYSLAFGWRLSQEEFIKAIEQISILKLRLSYGQSGNQAISPYQSLATIQGVTTSFNNQLVPAVIEGRLENENLRWETTTQTNAGLDIELWDGKVFSTIDLYQKETEDLLQNITLAPNTGFTSALINAGNVKNRGLELELGAYPLKKKLEWQISGNISWNRNEITDLGSVEEQFADRLGSGNGLSVFPFIQRVGLPIGSIYGYVEDGIFQNQDEVDAFIEVQSDAEIGQIRYADTNDDGIISEEDRTIIGDVNPDYIWGVSNAFKFKDFDLSFLFQGVQGADIINTLNIRFHNLDGRRNIPVAVYESAWTGEGSSDDYRQINLNNGNSRFSDRFIEDGSFIRLKNVQLGYTINAPKVEWLSGSRVYLSAVNLWTKTDYTGYDPEVSAFSSASMKGVDLGSYPQSKTYRLGINLIF